MRVQHIDVDAHADLVTQTVGVQRALAGEFSRFECLDLTLAGHHPKKGGARGLRYVAARAFQVTAGLVAQGHRFADAVLRRKAGKQRNVQAQADGGRVGGERGRRGCCAARVARGVVAAGQVQRGLVAGFGLGDFQLGDLQVALRLADAGVCRFGLQHPGVDICRLDRAQHRRRGQAARLRALFADQLVERNFFHAQVVLGGNFLRQHQVVAGLGFTGVGDGGGANFKVALGRGQLLGHSRLLGFYKGQAVLRGQRVKVGLAGTHNQVLLGGVKQRARQVHLFFALVVSGPVARAVQRLRSADRAALRIEGAAESG